MCGCRPHKLSGDRTRSRLSVFLFVSPYADDVNVFPSDLRGVRILVGHVLVFDLLMSSHQTVSSCRDQIPPEPGNISINLGVSSTVGGQRS